MEGVVGREVEHRHGVVQPGLGEREGDLLAFAVTGAALVLGRVVDRRRHRDRQDDEDAERHRQHEAALAAPEPVEEPPHHDLVLFRRTMSSFSS